MKKLPLFNPLTNIDNTKGFSNNDKETHISKEIDKTHPINKELLDAIAFFLLYGIVEIYGKNM